jgi:ammonium transporter, Amt family
LNHNYIQLGYQLAGSTAGFGYAFAGSCAILFVMNLIPGLSLRASDEAETIGIDDAELGEFAYDYVEVTREPPGFINETLRGTGKLSGHSEEDAPVHEAKHELNA